MAMDEPTSKAPAIDLAISRLTGKSREQQLAAGLCMTCSGEAKEFKNELSRKEYRISGMCQTCQDDIFG